MINDTFVLKKAFCCPGLQNHVEAAGQRGIAVILKKNPLAAYFALQSRGFAFQDLSMAQSKLKNFDVRINIACDVGIQYCPWCGTSLAKLIKASPEFFAELAHKHKELEAVATQ